MEYTQLMIDRVERVGVITINNPPNNAFSKKMIMEMINVLNDMEKDNEIRCIMLKSTGPNFSKGADANDIHKDLNKCHEIKESFSKLGGELVELLDNYPKPTLVAAKGECIGGSTAVFNAFDIRIVAENFNIKDGDIYYGTVGSWGMSSLRLPIWIGRNKIMDYMFLNEGFNGRQAYDLGLVSKVVSVELVNEVGLNIAKKMATAAPIAVSYFKKCVNKAIYSNLESARNFELEAAKIVLNTEDSKAGLAAVIKGEQAEFKGR